MKRIYAAIGLLVSVSAALADSPHFIKSSGGIDGSGNYVATFKEVGLGNGAITYRLTAGTENFTFQCFTKSGGQPQGDPNGVSFSNDSSLTTLFPTHNGSITGSALLSPQKGDASCQGNGLKLCLVAVAYQNISITDTYNDITVALPDVIDQSLRKPDCTY